MALREEALKAFRASATYPHQAYDLEPPHQHITHPAAAALIQRETSMVFMIPGWETWSVRKIAKYRAREEKANFNLFSCESTPDPAPGSWWHALEKKWRGWEGLEERTSVELDRELKLNSTFLQAR